MRRVLGLGILCAAVFAQEPDDVSRRVERLERELQEERGRGQVREKRLAELEAALRKATDALAQSQDRRGLEAEIDDYLSEHGPVTGDDSPSRLNIGGVIVTSARFTDLSNNVRSNTFLVDEVYLRFVYRFSDDITARYYTDGSIAELEVHFHDLLQLNVGRVIVPFGQFNARSFPDTFDTLTRPLMYLGDEDIFTTPQNNPSPFFRTIYTDTGFVLSGNHWKDGDQLYYAVFVTNGLVGTTDLGQSASFADNNDNKQLGARITYTITSWWERTRAGFGLSWMTGKYDSANSLSYRMYGADFVVVIDGLFNKGEGSITIRGEYGFAPREILPPVQGDPTMAINEARRVQGAYIIVEARLDPRWMFYVEGDWMTQMAPLLMNGAIDPNNTQDVRSTIWRVSVGVVYSFRIGVVWKTEYAYWDYDLDAPDAHRLSTQVVVPF